MIRSQFKRDNHAAPVNFLSRFGRKKTAAGREAEILMSLLSPLSAQPREFD
jgi:hypothetical protein